MKKIVFAFSVLAALMMSACLPETRNEMLGIPEGAILLSTENFVSNNTKTAVSGTSVVWVGENEDIDFYVGTGDVQNRSVVVSGHNAYISVALNTSTGLSEENNYIRGYYPAGISDGNETTDGPRLKLPAEYTCSISGDRQVIALPMVGRADADATSIKFKHITAAVNVKLMNSLASDLYIDKVVVTSETYQVCTPTGYTHNLKREDLGVSTSTTGTGNRSVTVNFSGDDFLVEAGSDDQCVQVPIRPIGSDHLTIEVYCHSATKSYHYSYRPDDAVSAVGRNEVLTAKVNLELTANGGHMEEVVVSHDVDLSIQNSTFSANDGDILIGTPKYSGTTCNIPAGATVTLKNVDASTKYLYLRAAGDATIIISGTNTLKGTSAILHVVSGSTLTIQGGSTDNLNLTVTSSSQSNNAAIGCYNGADCGNIFINGGTIVAIVNRNAAAIGSIQGQTCGNITISGGTITATNNAGTGYVYGAGIGCGGTGICGDILITGGSVSATGCRQSAGIGTSGSTSGSKCGSITITTGVTSISATKGSAGSAYASIGRGYSGSTIEGTVTVMGVVGEKTDNYTYPSAK